MSTILFCEFLRCFRVGVKVDNGAGVILNNLLFNDFPILCDPNFKDSLFIADDIVFFEDPSLPSDVYGFYGGFLSSQNVTWKDFYNRKMQIPVKISSVVLESDEAIVAVLGHEMHELNALREMYQSRQNIPALELKGLLEPGRPKNLHDQAWDVGNALVSQMRQSCKK